MPPTGEPPLISRIYWICVHLRSGSVSDEVYPHALLMFINCAILLAGLYFLLRPPSISQGAAFRWLGALLVPDAASNLILQFLRFGPLTLSFGPVYPLSGVSLTFGPIAWIEFAYSLFRRPIPAPFA